MLVFNASPLIVSAKAGLLDLFTAFWPELLVPNAVANEILKPGLEKDPSCVWLMDPAQAHRRVDVSELSPFLMAWDLGAGESSVLQYCIHHPGAVAVLDDLAARKCAEACNVPVIGTIGLILKASKLSPSFSLQDAIQAVRDAGLYLSETLISQILTSGQP